MIPTEIKDKAGELIKHCKEKQIYGFIILLDTDFEEIKVIDYGDSRFLMTLQGIATRYVFSKEQQFARQEIDDISVR